MVSSRSSTPSNAHFRGVGIGGGQPHAASVGSSPRVGSPHQYDYHGDASTSALGVTRSRTLLFLSYRDSVPRASPALPGGGADPLGATGAGKGKARAGPEDADGATQRRRAGGAYFDASGELRGGGRGARGEDDYGEEYGYGKGGEDRDTASLIRRDTHVVEMPSLPPKWVDVSDEVDAILVDLQPRVAQLDRLHAKHLLPGFVDRTKEEREIERLSGEITKEFRRCSKLIASLAASTQSLIRSGTSSTHEVAMAQNVQTALAQRVQLASGQFRKKQSNYMQRLRGQDIRHQEVLGELGLARRKGGRGGAGGAAAAGAGTPGADEELAVREDLELSRQQLAQSRSQAGTQSQSQLLLQEEETAAGPQDAEIAQRNHEITSIAESILELSTLFQDLQGLVIAQGSLVDRIDYNIETMGQNLESAAQELTTAARTQRRTGRGQCILLLMLLCALCVAVIIVKPFWRFFVGGGDAPREPPVGVGAGPGMEVGR